MIAKMQRNRKTAIILAVMLSIIAVVSSWVVFTYLPFSPERFPLTIGCLVAGIIGSSVFYCVLTKLPDKRSVRVVAYLLVGLVIFAPLVSVVFPRVTYAQFGLTVYGITPVPVLDITVDRNGSLWFRPKTHVITRTELEALISPEVEVVIVGIGWDSVARLADDAKQLGDSIELRVVSTPAAFDLYNQLKSEGRCVVLLAHSTC